MYNQYDIYILQNPCDTRASHGLESSLIIKLYRNQIPGQQSRTKIEALACNNFIS